MSPHRKKLLLFVLLVVCMRATLVLSLADVFGYGEEFAKSGAAKAILDGLPLPHHQLNYAYHEGGGFIVSHLEALGFLLLGPCVLVVKLVAIFFAIATLVAGAWMIAEHVSERAAYVFAVLFAFAPETFQRVSLLSLGTHVEACVLILLTIHFAARTVRNDDGAKRSAFWMGICGGLGCYFGLQMPPVLFVCGVAILVSIRGRAVLPIIIRALAGFAIGGIPLWWMMSNIGVGGVFIYRESHAQARPGFFESLPVLVAPILQSQNPLTWLQAITFVVAIVWGLAIRRTRLQWILVGYLLIFVIGWGVSGLVVPYDERDPGAFFGLLRLVPPWLVVTVLASFGIESLWSSGGAKRVSAIATIAIAVAAGTKGTITLARAGRPGSPIENASILLSRRGYSYQEYFVQLAWHIPATTAEKAAIFLRSKDAPALLAPDIANALYATDSPYAKPENKNRPLETILPEIEAVFGERRDLALLGLGMSVHGNWNFDYGKAYARIEALPEDVREPLAEALGRSGAGPSLHPTRLHRQLAVTPPDRWHAAWWRGMGWRVHQTLRLRPDLARATLAQLAERDRGPATIGYERALALDSIR